MFIIMAAIYVLVPVIDHLMLSGAAFIFVLVFVIYSSKKS